MRHNMDYTPNSTIMGISKHRGKKLSFSGKNVKNIEKKFLCDKHTK